MLDKGAVAERRVLAPLDRDAGPRRLLHLFFNMYALFLVGPVVERWYGSIRFVVFYLLCAAAGSVASYVFGDGAVRGRGLRSDLRPLRDRARRRSRPSSDSIERAAASSSRWAC